MTMRGPFMVAALCAAAAPPAATQEAHGAHEVEVHETFDVRVAPPELTWVAGPAQAEDAHVVHDVRVMDVVVGLGGEPVTGAPYSALAVTEVVQRLGDGNRIVREVRAPVHRDAQGRTRREPKLAAVGPVIAGGEPAQRVLIDDPVAAVSWVLDPERKTARRRPRPHVEFLDARSGAAPAVRVDVRRSAEPEHEVVVHAESRPALAAVAGGYTTLPPPPAGEGRAEPLGSRRFDAVSAEGVRHTRTIAAGAVGNERPIEIVTERWYSEELKEVVLRRHQDPRFGTTTYRLDQLRLGDPDPALFEVPSDYEVIDAGPGENVFIHRRDDDN